MSARPLTELDSLTRLALEDLDVVVSDKSSRHAILYFHGFPGPFEKLPSNEPRIADEIYLDVKADFDFYYPLYSLKRTAGFSFEETLKDGIRVFEHINSQKKYTSLTVIGQSWGAVIAVELARKHLLDQLILITPFVGIPTGKVAQGMVAHYSSLYPGLLKPNLKAEYVSEIEIIAANHSPSGALISSKNAVRIFASENDEVVPIELVRKIAAQNPLITLEILNGQTHKVEDREPLRKALLKLLKP